MTGHSCYLFSMASIDVVGLDATNADIVERPIG